MDRPALLRGVPRPPRRRRGRVPSEPERRDGGGLAGTHAGRRSRGGGGEGILGEGGRRRGVGSRPGSSRRGRSRYFGENGGTWNGRARYALVRQRAIGESQNSDKTVRRAAVRSGFIETRNKKTCEIERYNSGIGAANATHG